MRRFSIRNLMGLVLAVAVGFAALRNADDYWAGGLLSITALFLGLAALGGLFAADRKRAGWLGFVVFGGGYFALAFLGLSERNLTRLPTSWILSYVHQRVAPQQTFTFMFSGAPGGSMGQVLTSNVQPGAVANTVTTTTLSQFAVASAASGNSTTRWGLLLPGAANVEAFSVVGHCLFSLSAGVLGTFIALRMWARREARDPQSASPEV